MKRVRINFDDKIFQALTLRSTKANRSISELVNTAVRVSLVEDQENLADIERRTLEIPIPYSDFLAELKKRAVI